ncbi:MAG: V-type ATP synthase subunit D [Candidatus Aenigmarchaeota archaeon]|nr:V-type ATP synthase subunit D [Candidatus Aenigmarchaeota archaeon]
MAIQVKPTRSELIALRKKIRLAASGHKLLKKKRDGLILEFFNVLKDAKKVRAEINQKYNIAYGRMIEAMALDGVAEIKNIALALKQKPSVEIEVRNIMGVNVPKIKSAAVKKTLLERGYGLLSSSIRIEEMVKAYEDLLESVILAAEVETKLRKILADIERTKRRVNSLEYLVIPRLTEQSRFISFRLEEMDRENIFRMKKIKAKISG